MAASPRASGQVLMEQVVYETGLGPVADSELHGLRHAARRYDVQRCDPQQSGSDRRRTCSAQRARARPAASARCRP